MTQIIDIIRKDLNENADIKIKENFQHYFKEQVKFYGVKTGTVTKIANKHWKEIKNKNKKEIFDLCEELFRSNYCEESFIVSTWIPKLKNQYDPNDFITFQHWINSYITNWASCDTFCNQSMGKFIEQFPEFLQELKKWTSSTNRWMRRAAAVSLIIPARRGKFLMDVFEIADLLQLDKDDLVQKGYGWLLKEASKPHQLEVYNYVLSKKKVMPRTALRYAIEKMPQDMKLEAMKRDWK